jgi:hypothetical protein
MSDWPSWLRRLARSGVVDMGAEADKILCANATQEDERSPQAQRGSVTCLAPAAQQSVAQPGDDSVGFVGDAGAVRTEITLPDEF